MNRNFLGEITDTLTSQVSMCQRICEEKGLALHCFEQRKNGQRHMEQKKLYISAHSAVESQAFYHKMGCAEAAVYNQSHVETEPYDCQLECKVCEDDS